jgi:CrcB protein
MFKEFMLVGMGSFFGGGMRFLLSKLIQSWAFVQFPLGTFAVNILGCLLLGFSLRTSLNIGWLTPSARLILTTGFCGGIHHFLHIHARELIVSAQR